MSDTLYRLTIVDGVFCFTPVTDEQSERVLFASPVTGVISKADNVFGADWFDATGYCTYYTSAGRPAYHTGADLNRPNYADAGMPVYASADGVIVFCGDVQGWQGDVIIIEHTLEDDTQVWTRYAHIAQNVTLTYNQPITRGAQIGTIADYTPKGPQGDHLHFDVALTDLSVNPGDWPGMDKNTVLNDYVDPAKWLKARSQ